MRLGVALAGLILLAVPLLSVPTVAQQTPSQSKPDLVPVQINVEPADVEPGESAEIVAVVENRGEANAEGFWVRLRVDGSIRNTQLVSGLDGGERFTWRSPWVVAPEASELQVQVDATDRVAESDETNNELTTEIGFAADLTLSQLSLEPRFPKPGDDVQIRATIANPSGHDVERTFAVAIQAERSAVATRFVEGLAAGSSTTVTASWTAEAGPQLIRAEADSFDRIPEANADNNRAFVEVDVSARASMGADLTVTEVKLRPERPSAGQTASLQATVANVGDNAVRSFDVVFWADGQPISRTTLSQLGAGESTVVRAAWAVEPGQRRLRALADADHVVPEPDEGNNGRALTVDLGAQQNACGQPVYLRLPDDAIDELMAMAGVGPEPVRNRYFPQIKRVMETQFEGINVRFVYRRPGRTHGTVAFREADESPILGRAPIGQRFSTGNVYLGSFIEFGLGSFAVSRVPLLVGTVASHELGHMFGLRHPSPQQGGIMDASTELSPVSELRTFRDEARRQLEDLLPMACN